MSNRLVLLVDDEPKILSSLTRELYEIDVCEVMTAQSGAEGLEIVKKIPNLMVIVSDYHMPGMDGIRFLSEAQKISPDTTRIMLTGAAGLDMAINAVNLGQIFRFLLKPCPVEPFILSLKAGMKQYQLICSERELLQKTLNGSIKIMIDMLSAFNPDTFAQANRLRVLARGLAEALQMPNNWEVELAALLCRIGSVTIPPEILNQWMKGYPLKEKESAMIQTIPKVSAQFVQNIPRLENVARAIASQSNCYKFYGSTQNTQVGDQIPVIGRILKLVIDYDRFLGIYQNSRKAFGELLNHADDYDPNFLGVFRNLTIGQQNIEEPSISETSPDERRISVDDLVVGMTLVNDVIDRRGRLVVSARTVITDILKCRLINYLWTQEIMEQVVVRETKLI